MLEAGDEVSLFIGTARRIVAGEAKFFYEIPGETCGLDKGRMT